MDKLKKILLPSTSIISLLAIIMFGFLDVLPFADSLHRYAATVIVGAVIVLALCFVKEKNIYESSTVIYILVIMLLIYQIFFHDNEITFGRYIIVGGTVINTAVLTSLCSMQVSKLIGRNKHISTADFLVIMVVAALPIILVFPQNNNGPILIALIVFAIVVLRMKTKKRLTTPWNILMIPAVLCAAHAIIGITSSKYYMSRLEVILTRGQCSPFYQGWQRITIDKIIQSATWFNGAPLPNDIQSKDIITGWNGFNCFSLLLEYGWFAFIAALLVYAILFISMYKMVKQINQSPFAKYLSFTVTTILCSLSVVNILGIFILDTSFIDMPFFHNNYSVNITYFVLYGIVLSLYLHRNQTLDKAVVVKPSLAGNILKRIDVFHVKERFDNPFAPAEESSDDIDDASEVTSLEDTIIDALNAVSVASCALDNASKALNNALVGLNSVSADKPDADDAQNDNSDSDS